MEPSSSPEPNTSGDESSTMGRSHGKGGYVARRPDLDLSAMLNMEQKINLQKLIDSTLDGIQHQLRDNLDKLGHDQVLLADDIQPPKPAFNLIPNPRSEKYKHLYGDIGMDKKFDLEDPESLRAIMLPQPVIASLPPCLTLPKSPEEATANAGKTENELIVSSLSELKRDLLGHFGKWRNNVTKRLADIVIKNGGTGGNIVGQGSQHAPGNARRHGFAARGRQPRVTVLTPSVEQSNAVLASLYRPTENSLQQCPKEKRALILHCMMLLIVGVDQYTSYARILLMRLASSLQIPMHVLAQDECRLAQAFATIVDGIPPEEIAQRRLEEGKPSRRFKAVAASGGTPTRSGVTLAPPLIELGIGTVFGGLGLSKPVVACLLGPIAESTVAVGTFFGLYGARQSGKMMDAYGKDIQEFGLMQLHGSLGTDFVDPKDVPAADRRMRVTVAISGWLMHQDEITDPWRILGSQNEAYVMRWEPEALVKMGHALDTLVKNAAWTLAKKEIVNHSVYMSLKHSIWPIGLVKASKLVDNPWSTGMVRAEKAGVILAEIIMNRVHGERPVTLVGYSLGARVIYSCLMSLAERRVFGSVENAVLIGAPCPSEIRVWAALKSVVAGRLVNVYSKDDYLLGFLCRTGNWQYGIAGLQKIQGVPGVENFDVTPMVPTHNRYQYLVGGILKKIGWEDVEYHAVTDEMKKLSVLRDEERKIHEERETRIPVGPSQEAKEDQAALSEKTNQLVLAERANQTVLSEKTNQAPWDKAKENHGGQDTLNGKANAQNEAKTENQVGQDTPNGQNGHIHKPAKSKKEYRRQKKKNRS
ncbi:hypothetical protein F4778DRAFT_777365 [Xylariomycetidae sp. FL2044]|nr:hypothetical protein F4778DRAFT_777365 [Xylariomycetidae sp. FL2044]